MVPEGWKLITAQDVCKSIFVGVVIKPTQYYVEEADGVKAFRSANVREGFINDNDWVYFSLEGHLANKKSQLKANDVLIVRTGYPGTACVVTPEFEGSNAIDIVIARPDVEQVAPEYLCAYTNSHMGKSQVLDLQGGLAQKHLNVGGYKVLKIKLPPLPEQKKIAQVLSTWDKAITTTEQLLANSQQQKKALMQQLLTGKKRLLDENGVRFSGGWQAYKFGDLFKERVETGRDDLPLLSITADDGVVYQEDTGRKNTSNEDKSKYRRICVNDIGYNTMRMWQGRSSLSDKEGIVSPAYTIVTPTDKVCPAYAAYLFKLPALVHVFYRHSQGLVSDTWNLKFNHFKKIAWQVPGIDEQRKIATVLSSADQEGTVLQKKLDALKQEKKALMQQLLTGKRRVKAL